MSGRKDLEIIITKSKTLWNLRQSMSIDGSSFLLGQFLVNIGNVTVGSERRGVFLQVLNSFSERL